MRADPRFLAQPREFWAYVRTISQEVGYTKRRNARTGAEASVCVPELADVRCKFHRLRLDTSAIADDSGALTDFGRRLFGYFEFRAAVLNATVREQLMRKEDAEAEFKRLKATLEPQCPLPMNKQTGAKKTHAFLSGIVNMLIEASIGDAPCDYDPRSLTMITRDALPLRTLSRRVDGAFPSVVDPVAIWEIKEYYYTTTFGSRVADGVYETLLDGMELEELRAAGRSKVWHVLFIDDYYTWWECGRSYLCRMIDMLHMGYVDEIVFGREVLTRLPLLVREWKAAYDRGNA